MTVRITPFASASTSPARYGSGAIMLVLGGQSGDRTDLAVGSENHTADFAEDSVVVIDVTSACVVAIGENATADPAKSEPWAAGANDVRFVRAGERVSVY